MRIHTPQQLHAHEAGSDKEPLHLPVLLDQVVELLAPRPGETYLDLTAGYGGHAQAIVDRLGDYTSLTLVDRDDNAIAALEPFGSRGSTIVHDDFAHFTESAVNAGKAFDMVLVDFGVSSPQLDRAERGFSITRPGPLDMRMDNRLQRTAADWVNRATEKELISIIVLYGEERPSHAARIARAIVRSRPHRTTEDLARAVLSTHRGPRAKVHPATRTFQAIRIACNDELAQIQQLLENITQLLNPGGRIAFISFHSLEDRLVQQYLSEQTRSGYESTMTLLTKRAILGKTDDVHNPRARSAILRAAVKNKKKG